MKIQIQPITIPQNYVEKINTLNDNELVDAWKRAFEKTKRYPKNSHEYTLYANISNYMYGIHTQNNQYSESE